MNDHQQNPPTTWLERLQMETLEGSSEPETRPARRDKSAGQIRHANVGHAPAPVQNDELLSVLEVTRDIASMLELEPLLDLVLERLESVVDCTGGSILTLEGDAFVVRAYRGPTSRGNVLGLRFPLEEYFSQRLLAATEPIMVPDVMADTPETREISKAARVRYNAYPYVRSWLGVPLIVKGRVTGALTLHHDEPDKFTGLHAAMAMAFANQAAVAIENARLFRAEQRRAEQFRVIAELGRCITSILSLDELLAFTVRSIHDSFGYYHVHLGLIAGDEVVFKAANGVWWNSPRCEPCEAVHIKVGRDGMSGRVAASGEPMLVQDVSRDPRYIPVQTGEVGAALVLPVKVKGQVIGVLDVESHQVNGFDESDVLVLQSLADQVAVAIENARLYEQARELAAVEERQKLARELHDSVSQALYGIALGTATAGAHVGNDPHKAAESLEYVQSLTRAAQAEMRALIFELRPESLENEGLVAAFTKLADSLRARKQIMVNVTFCAEPDVPLHTKQALYRIGQEALHNITKHAGASRVDITLDVHSGALTLEIMDDGKGFNPGGDFPGHLGLRSMRERAAQAGGTFAVYSSPGRGAHLRVQVPA